MAKKKRVKKRVELVPLSVRVDRSTRDELDRMAADVGMSRAQLVSRILRDVIRVARLADDASLWDDWAADIERAVREAVDHAARQGRLADFVAPPTKGGQR